MRGVWRSNHPLLLTLAGICIPLLVLSTQKWESLRNVEQVSHRVLAIAASQRAESIAQAIERDFRSSAIKLLEEIDHRAVRQMRLEPIARHLQEREALFPFVDQVFVWGSKADASGGTLQRGKSHPVASFSFQGTDAPPLEEAASRGQAGFVEHPALSRVFFTEATEFAAFQRNFALSTGTYEGRHYHVVYHLLYSKWWERFELEAFLGFAVDLNRLGVSYFPTLIDRFARQDQDVPWLAPTVVSLFDEEGREVYRTGRSLQDEYEGQATFPFLFFDLDVIDSISPSRPDVNYWTVRTGYERGTREAVALVQTGHQRWLWLMIGGMAVCGMVLTAVAAVREVRFARLRADFLSGLSHDLKTPLAKIQLFADTLRSGRGITPDKMQQYHDIISSQAHKLAYLIAANLDLARIEAGIRSCPMEELDLRQILRTTLGVFDYDLTQAGFRLEVRLPDQEVPIAGNAERLQQLFGNLISNAIRYSKSDRYLGVAVDTAQGFARVEIVDHGIGIPRTEHRKIFRKFYRVSEHTSGTAAAGSGLGLAIASHVARMHKARITIRSTPGEGSSFTVEFPLLSEARQS